MNGSRSKIIRKLVNTKFSPLYLMIRNRYGEETKKMNEKQIYKIAKKMWVNKILGVEKWVYQKGEK